MIVVSLTLWSGVVGGSLDVEPGHWSTDDITPAPGFTAAQCPATAAGMGSGYVVL